MRTLLRLDWYRASHVLHRLGLGVSVRQDRQGRVMGGMGVGATSSGLDRSLLWFVVARKGVEPPRTYRYGGWFPYPR